MRGDPIVEEIRANSKKWFDQFGGDLHAMFEELRRMERESGQEYVTLPPRRVEAPAVLVAPTTSPLVSDPAHQTH